MKFYGALLFFLSFVPGPVNADDWKQRFRTPFEQSDGSETADYHAAIQFYQDLADASDRITIREMGTTDSGHPLHLVVISNRKTDVDRIRDDERSVLLINNAIHPGESDGVDASMAFARDVAFDSATYSAHLKQVIVAIIPLYNIGGALHRNSGTRANQNGPREYGFRGNARNYDLNRDFIKCDTRNARSFVSIFQLLDPDLLIDTHVSNGADYQHVMTTSHSQKDKLGLQLGKYLDKSFEPDLFRKLQQDGFPTIPYVNSGGRPPEQGFSQFLETPRYSTGYAALFQTMGFMTETHMLKPYPRRVKATRAFLERSLELLAKDGQRIQEIRRADREAYHQQAEAAIAWEVDRDKPSRLEFHGYEATYVDSQVTPGKRLFYDRSKPFVRSIAYYNNYRPSKKIRLPAGYLVPRGWHSVIELLKLNSVELTVVQKPAVVDAQVYRIDGVTTRPSPYEGHYLHDSVNVTATNERVQVAPGDVIVPIHQQRARYVVETLEPEAMDSLFRWNFFDTILQRKEYFSAYVFEDSAKALLASNNQVAAEFQAKKNKDSDFANDRNAQLKFLYERSKHYEESHLRYPVIRLKEGSLEGL
ncbi:MAG TPA: hypothetical protein EYG03_26440 [Planctomycetes bacterium]|nr:hypothetical protein [Fuerstiella sp.]HIK95500.1 hypothetical protein [Planctomycetota bacterium]